MAQIPDGKQCRNDLPDDGCHGRTHHAPFAQKDKDRVENDIDSGPCQGGEHGKFRTAVCPDHGIHGLPEHVKRDAQRDIKEVLPGASEGFFIDRTAEHGNDAVRKNQIYSCQNKAGCENQHNGVAHALLCPFPFVPAQRHTDKGTAAVADHDGNGQRHDREGKHDRIGGVAIGAQIAGVGDKDLVDDVVQRAYQ